MKGAEFSLLGEIQATFTAQPEKIRISDIQFALAESKDGTQGIRFRKTGNFTLLSLDIRYGEGTSAIPVLTVSQDKGKLQVSFNTVSRDHQSSRSMSYSSPEGFLNSHTNRCGYTLSEADLLLTRGAFPETEVSEALGKINVEATAQKILEKFASLTQAPGGFEAVKVPELVEELFVQI